MKKKEIMIPGGKGRSFKILKNEYVVVTDVEGKQVADFIAFRADNMQEFASTTHTRSMNKRIFLQKGDTIYTNYRRPILRMVADTVGTHDLMFPCCDPMRYELDFGIKDHANCRMNFVQALESYDIDYSQIPDPINLFQNSPIVDGIFADPQEPKSRAGDYVIFQALTDAIIGISACPMDQTPLCGWNITDIQATVVQELDQDKITR